MQRSLGENEETRWTRDPYIENGGFRNCGGDGYVRADSKLKSVGWNSSAKISRRASEFSPVVKNRCPSSCMGNMAHVSAMADLASCVSDWGLHLGAPVQLHAEQEAHSKVAIFDEECGWDMSCHLCYGDDSRHVMLGNGQPRVGVLDPEIFDTAMDCVVFVPCSPVLLGILTTHLQRLWYGSGRFDWSEVHMGSFMVMLVVDICLEAARFTVFVPLFWFRVPCTSSSVTLIFLLKLIVLILCRLRGR